MSPAARPPDRTRPRPVIALPLVLLSCAAAPAASARILFRTWPYANPSANESETVRQVDLSSSPPTLTTLAHIPRDGGAVEASLYVGGGALSSAGLWYSSTCEGSTDFPPCTGVLTAFDTTTNKLSARVRDTVYCDHLFFDAARLLCLASVPWFYPPGAPHSNDDIDDLQQSLLELDPATGNHTFLGNFTREFVLSYGSPTFDAASGTLFVHVSRGLTADVEVWSVDVRASPPRIVQRSASARTASLDSLVFAPPPRGPALLAFAELSPPASNYSLGLYAIDVAVANISLRSIGAPTLYPRFSYTTGAASLSADGATLYAIAVDDKRASTLIGVDTRTGAVALALPLSDAVCPDDPSPCVIADLQFLDDLVAVKSSVTGRDPAAASRPARSDAVPRPSYNTGDGFFVLNGTLFDANGVEFRMRGVDRCHYDSNSAAGMARAAPNTVRIFVETCYGASWQRLAGIVHDDHIAHQQVPVVTAAATTSCVGTSGSSNVSLLEDIVENSWVAPASVWTPLNRWMIINVANEWGPANSSVWRDAYVAAVAKLRSAGFLGTLLIDAGGSGQDLDTLAYFANDVFESDAQRNIMFALHPYGSVNAFSAQVASVTKGRTTVVTLVGGGVCHPFAPHYCPALNMTNTWGGISSYFVSGVQGMTELNGAFAAPENTGGKSGAWTVTLNVDSTEFGDYSGGGWLVDNYGNYALRIARLAALRDALRGPAFALTEFGPGRNIGPSPTLVTPLQVIEAAEANGLGWMAWAWEDGGTNNNNEWFAQTYHDGAYSSEADLTMFGQEIVEGCTNPTPGGCGCPDDMPLPPYFNPDDPLAPPPPVYAKTPAGCVGVPAPQYQALSLKLAVPATIFNSSAGQR